MNKLEMKAYLQALESVIAAREESIRKFEAETKRFWNNVEKIEQVSKENLAERRAS